ncbi:MAG: glycosyltransferase family 4 protein [Vulcanimicrobiaceae bacterium]
MLKPGHVVVVNDTLHVDGGAAQVAISSAIGLRRRGYRVTVFGAVEPIAPELLAADVDVISLGQRTILEDNDRRRAATQGIWNATAYRRFRAFLESCDARDTVVHVHGWVKSLSASVVRAAEDVRIPVVVTLHDFFSACPNGALFDHPAQEICHRDPMSLACITRNCDSRSALHKAWRVVRHVAQERIGHVPRSVSHFIAVSKNSLAILAPMLPPGRPVTIVNNPIDVRRESAADVGDNREFVYVGRLSSEKGVVEFARAARDAKVKAVFVGDGELRDAVEAANPDATCTGWLDRASSQARLRRARALVVPSLWYEAGPLVILEAAAAGVPAIVPTTCCGREFFVEGVSGISFAGGDRAALTAALQTYTDDDRVRAHGRAAYDRYWARPASMDRHLDGLCEVYATFCDVTPTRAYATAGR